MSKVYTLNENGQHHVRQFAESKGKDGVKGEAWFVDAEDAANDAFDRGLTATIEVGALMSYDQRAYILTLDQQWFDAREVA